MGYFYLFIFLFFYLSSNDSIELSKVFCFWLSLNSYEVRKHNPYKLFPSFTSVLTQNIPTQIISEPTNHKTNLIIIIYIIVSKVGDRSRGWPEGSPFHSYYTEVLGRALLHSLDCSTLPLICTLWCWVLSKAASRTIFWSLWYDSTWDWTSVSQTIGKHLA